MAGPSGSKPTPPSGGRPGDSGPGTVPRAPQPPLRTSPTSPRPGDPAPIRTTPTAPRPTTPTPAPAPRPTTPTPRPTTPRPTPAPAPAPAPEAPAETPAPETPAPETPPTAPPAEEAPAAEATAKNNRLLFEQLAQMAQEAGLGELFSFTNGTPSGWLWDKIVNNEISDATFEFQVEQTDAFKRRYPAVAWLRAQNVSGASSLPATMAAVREYENQARGLMQAAGLPPEFYDNNVDDLQGLMMKNISLVELEQRVGEGWSRVQATDPAIRQAFSEFYGVGQGDAALAAFFLDPTQMVQKLDRMSRTAYTAGLGRNAGINLSKVAAERITALEKAAR